MNSFYNRLSDVCNNLLNKNEAAINYLSSRGIKQNTIDDYRIGLFPKDLRLMFSEIDPKELLKHGIIWNASKSRFNTPCLYPIVIPIRDQYGKHVAVGCRTVLSDNERKRIEENFGYPAPKYKNSEYQKTMYLYGLDKAKRDIINNDSVFVVEGYFDVISAHQAGIKNVVATCGTLFSKYQLIILSRYTNNIVLLFDNDSPGHTSAKKIMDRFDNDPIIKANISCKFTPDGFKDIDEYIRRGGSLSFFNQETCVG